MIDTLREDLEYIYSKTSLFIHEFNERTILITGGTGFIGKWLLNYFLWLIQNRSIKLKIIILSRNPDIFLKNFPEFENHNFQFIQGDITKVDFGQFPYCDFIIHAAADADAKVNIEQPLKIISTIIDGTRKLLEYGVKVKLKKMLYISSGAVYGIQPDYMVCFPENYFGGPDILSPGSAYSEAKRLSELYCGCYQKHYQLSISIARCFAFVGPYLPLDKHFAIGNFIRNGLNGEDIIIQGTGEPLRSYLYAADMIIWLLFVLFKGIGGEAYNVGSDFAVSIKNLAEIITEFFPLQKVKILGKSYPTERNQNYIPCIDKIKTELKVPNILPLNEAILRTIQFYMENEKC